MAEPTVRGSFVWHELMTTDVPAAVAYYKKVVGWKTQPFDANYLMWVAKSGPIGGVHSLAAGESAPYWLPYVGVTDIEATVQQARKLGGKVVTPVTDIPNAGRYAVLADPQGAVFGVHWSPKATPPGKPQLGDMPWHELATSDYPAAFAFYQALFGWEKVGEHDMGAMGMYFMYGLNGIPLGGMFNILPSAPMPTAWCCYAEVADARKAAKVAAKAGGKVLNGPMPVPGGSWIAQIADPQGCMHAVVSSAPMAEAAPAERKVEASAAVAVKKASKKKATKKKAVPAKSAQKTAKKKSVKKASKKVVKKATKKPVKKTASKPAPQKKMAKKKTKLKKSSAKKTTKKTTKKTKIAKKKAAKKK